MTTPKQKKISEKHGKKKPLASSPPPPTPPANSPELPLPSLPTPPADLPAFARAERIFADFPAALRFTDAQLRNIERELDPAGHPWIPPARRGLRPTAATLAGLFARATHQAARANAEAQFEQITFPSMEACQARTGIQKSFLQTAKTNGCDAFEGSRVRLAKLLRWTFSRDEQTGERTENWTAHGEKFDALNKEVKYRESLRELVPRLEITGLVQEAAAIYFAALKRLEMEAPRDFEARDKTYIKKEMAKKLRALEKQLTTKFQTLADAETPAAQPEQQAAA